MKGLIWRISKNLQSRVVYRIFFPFFLIIVLGVGFALPYGLRTTSSIMQNHADDQVLSITRVVSNIIRKDLDKLLTFCELKIYSQPIQDAINKRDIYRLRQLIIPMKTRSAVDIVIIFDREGNVMLRFDESMLLGENLKDMQIVRNGLNGMPYQEIVITPSKLVLCAIAPNETTAVPGGMNGAMLVGQVVDDNFVDEIKQTTGADLVISNPEGVVMASTLVGLGDFTGTADWKEATSALLEGAGEILSTFFVGKIPFKTAHQRFIIHQQPRAIISVIMDVTGIYQTQRNITTVMIVLMIIGVAMAVLMSLLIAHSISRPIQSLVRATEDMAAGHLDQRDLEVSGDEIGRLSQSFNLMKERIRRDIKEIQDTRNSAQRNAKELEAMNRELKKARNELIQASKLIAMGQLGAGIAHELNQPLLAIGLFAEQTLKYLDKGTNEYKNLERIIGQSNRMGEIIKEIRLFARQSLFEPKSININIPLEKALNLVEKQLVDMNIKIIEKHAEDLSPVMADDNQLQQVFLNIITNARDAMAPKGEGTLILTTRSLNNGQFVAIDFNDNGVGIPSDIMDDIFMPFFTTKKEVKGLGLGLSISYGIIERHSGTIRIESQEGEGAMLRILLPTIKAKRCWEVIGCEQCDPRREKDICPVYKKERDYFCWTYFQRHGTGDRFAGRCERCALYKERQPFFVLRREEGREQDDGGES